MNKNKLNIKNKQKNILKIFINNINWNKFKYKK